MAEGWDAIVVGGGPNGLAAAIALARTGHSVQLVEGEATVGGGCRSGELTLPGFIHDLCSAVHPLGRSSPSSRNSRSSVTACAGSSRRCSSRIRSTTAPPSCFAISTRRRAAWDRTPVHTWISSPRGPALGPHHRRADRPVPSTARSAKAGGGRPLWPARDPAVDGPGSTLQDPRGPRAPGRLRRPLHAGPFRAIDRWLRVDLPGQRSHGRLADPGRGIAADCRCASRAPEGAGRDDRHQPAGRLNRRVAAESSSPAGCHPAAGAGDRRWTAGLLARERPVSPAAPPVSLRPRCVQARPRAGRPDPVARSRGAPLGDGPRRWDVRGDRSRGGGRGGRPGRRSGRSFSSLSRRSSTHREPPRDATPPGRTVTSRTAPPWT